MASNITFYMRTLVNLLYPARVSVQPARYTINFEVEIYRLSHHTRYLVILVTQYGSSCSAKGPPPLLILDKSFQFVPNTSTSFAIYGWRAITLLLVDMDIVLHAKLRFASHGGNN